MKRQVVVPLVVLLIAALLAWWPRPGSAPVVDLPDDLERCAENLRALYAGLGEYRQRSGHAPEAAGVGFLAELIASGVWPDDGEHRARLTCPGTGAEAVRADVDYRQPAGLSERDSAYAARDTANFPLVKFPSGGAELEPLVACDDGRNHAGALNLLQSDGSVLVLELERLIEQGLLPPEATTIPVGPTSPIPALRKLVQGKAP